MFFSLSFLILAFIRVNVVMESKQNYLNKILKKETDVMLYSRLKNFHKTEFESVVSF